MLLVGINLVPKPNEMSFMCSSLSHSSRTRLLVQTVLYALW